MTHPDTIPSILAFWRDAGRDRWFTPDERFDEDVGRRFKAVWQAAAEHRLDGWRETPDGALALVIVLDQFPRNMFRGSAQAYATDEAAREVAGAAIAAGFDREVDPDLRPFFFLPFMHSEDLADQERCVALYAEAGDEDGVKWARLHRDIIARFGRFPHRNPALGRETSPEEAEYLAGDGFKG